MTRQCECVMFWLLMVWSGGAAACICPSASVPALPLSTAPPGGCCLNLSGSALGHAHWEWFGNVSGLEVLDLSHCNITHIHKEVTDTGPLSLTKLFLNHNRLRSVPRGLLSSMFNLTELYLQGNQIQDLPPDLLQDSDRIQILSVRENRLRSLPGHILKKSSLISLDLEQNPWDCSCDFIEDMGLSSYVNHSSGLGALANLSCASPPALSGQAVSGVSVGEVCHPTRLTILFISLPLLILSALVLCWCCGRTKSKEVPTTFSAKKKPHSRHSNGHKQLPKPPPLSPPLCDQSQEAKPESVLQNQLLLCPSSALLRSTRDMHQEVEGRLGSVESLPRAGSLSSSLGAGPKGPGELEVELDAVSVTEVLRDSADREKAYLSQSTEYYSLVPGMQLDDSDPGEFDSVDLT